MNRIIKFRAWCREGEWEDDKEKREFRMIDADSLSFCDAEPLINQLKDIEDDFYLMQFTGLLDKNGKEIYEGDITEVLAEDGVINRFIVKFGIARRKMASGWEVDIPSFYFDLIGGDEGFKAFPIVNNYRGIHDLEMMNIIGNIFEHPGLIKH
jgi:uncharacterized phage protein (TIGR01671 family)